MSKPAAVNLKIAKVRGKAIPPGSTFAAIDWDRADQYLTGQHNPDDMVAAQATQILEDELAEYEKEGRESKVRKARSELNAYSNARMAVRSSWCPTCLNFLHNCQCQVEVDKVSTDFIDQLTSRLGPTHSMRRKARRLEKQGS
jgi:hypothetical protein